jgi:hypothetical protein
LCIGEFRRAPDTHKLSGVNGSLSYVGGVHAHVVPQQQVWIRGRAFDDGRICVENKQQPGCRRMATTNKGIFYAEALITEHRRLRLINIASELYVLLGIEHSISHDQDYRRVCMWAAKEPHR